MRIILQRTVDKSNPGWLFKQTLRYLVVGRGTNTPGNFERGHHRKPQKRTRLRENFAVLAQVVPKARCPVAVGVNEARVFDESPCLMYVKVEAIKCREMTIDPGKCTCMDPTCFNTGIEPWGT